MEARIQHPIDAGVKRATARAVGVAAILKEASTADARTRQYLLVQARRHIARVVGAVDRAIDAGVRKAA